MVRIKYRYLLVNFLYPPDVKTNQSKHTNQEQDDLPWVVRFRRPSPEQLDARLFARLIRDRVADLFGDYGVGLIIGSLQVKYLSTATSVAIVRVARAHYRLVWAALTSTTRMPKPIDQACVIQVIRVSGTIRKSEEEAIRQARSMILLARRTESNPTSNMTISLNSKAQNLSSSGQDDIVMADVARNPVDPSDVDESDNG